ncbi:MAG: Vms1/Ankzf1 family peptidyl-tRNA hydrolase [Acidimicrobiales bacterium]
MESSGTTPRVGLDCSDLQGVLDPNGQFLTVYLTTEPGEGASQHTALRWKALGHEPGARDASPAALEAVPPLLRDAHKGGRCLCVVIDGAGKIRHRSHHPDPPRKDVARWGTLPSLAPMIEWRQASPPHIVVLIDRVGADIVVFESPESGDFHVEVEGDDDVISKVGPGGWSQRRYQQRAENTWEANAKEVAAELSRIVEKVHARVVVVAGDVRAVQLLRDALPEQVQHLLHEVEGSRSPDGSVDAVASEAVTLVATAVAADTAELLAKFREELGQHDRAANGPEEVASALEGGQVETLLIHDDLDDERTCWIGPEAFHLALDASTLKDMGVDNPLEVRLVDGFLRAAIGTSARVRVVPSATVLDGAVGAVLRWSSNGNGAG